MCVCVCVCKLAFALLLIGLRSFFALPYFFLVFSGFSFFFSVTLRLLPRLSLSFVRKNGIRYVSVCVCGSESERETGKRGFMLSQATADFVLKALCCFVFDRVRENVCEKEKE